MMLFAPSDAACVSAFCSCWAVETWKTVWPAADHASRAMNAAIILNVAGIFIFIFCFCWALSFELRFASQVKNWFGRTARDLWKNLFIARLMQFGSAGVTPAFF